MNNMKIYEIGTGYTPIPAQISAATEIVVAELTAAFLKQNLPVEIVDIGSDHRAATTLPIIEVPVFRLFSGTDVHLGMMHKGKRVAYSVALVGILKKLLKQESGNVVLHFHNQYNLFFFLKRVPRKLRNRCRIVYTNHSGIWRLPWTEIEQIIRKRYFQEAECMKRADMVFVLNEETKINVVEHLGVDREKITVIGNGVNTDVYHPLPAEAQMEAKKKFGFGDCRVILQVGSVCENKGQLRTAEYLLPLLKGRENLVFAYAGGIVEEDYQQQIDDFAAENGLVEQIRYLGMISPGEELNELYNTAVATILSSRYEGFSLVSMESRAAGVPVLVQKDGPVPLGPGTVPYDLEDFTQIVEGLEDRPDMEARKFVIDQYSWDKIAADYVAEFGKKR